MDRSRPAPRCTEMTNTVFEAVCTVLAVRDFQDQPIPDEVMSRVVEAGRLTASSVNLQPWHFVLVKDRETLRQLGAMVRTGRFIAGAAAAIVVAYTKESEYGISDASRAIQSMILTAWADGVGSCWTGFGGMEGVRKNVGIPDRYDVLAVIPFGYPKRKLGLGKKKRKLLADVASAERFGTPLA
jgi:nitroreductase